MDDMTIVLATLIPYMALTLGFAVYCLIDIAKTESVRHLPKWAWAAICFLATPWGGIAYLVLGRDK